MIKKETVTEDFGASHCYALWRQYYEPKNAPEQLDGSRQTDQVLLRERALSIEVSVLEWLIQGAKLLRALAHQKSCKINDAWIREKSRSDYSHGLDCLPIANSRQDQHGTTEQELVRSFDEENQTEFLHELLDLDFACCVPKILTRLHPPQYQIIGDEGSSLGERTKKDRHSDCWFDSVNFAN